MTVPAVVCTIPFTVPGLVPFRRVGEGKVGSRSPTFTCAKPRGAAKTNTAMMIVNANVDGALRSIVSGVRRGEP
jgi:hypothetical protein